MPGGSIISLPVKEERHNDAYNDGKHGLQSLSDTAYLQLYTQALEAPQATAIEQTFLQTRYLSCLNEEQPSLIFLTCILICSCYIMPSANTSGSPQVIPRTRNKQFFKWGFFPPLRDDCIIAKNGSSHVSQFWRNGYLQKPKSLAPLEETAMPKLKVPTAAVS